MRALRDPVDGLLLGRQWRQAMASYKRNTGPLSNGKQQLGGSFTMKGSVFVRVGSLGAGICIHPPL